MKLTTKRVESGRYAVLADGKPTDLIIWKGDRPRWGERQKWDVVRTSDSRYLFSDRGLDHCLATLEHIAAALLPPGV